MSAQVFVSHSSKDHKVARTICTALESRGLECWIADRDVCPGENFQEAIVRAIRAAKIMVLVFTSNANNSDEIKKELALASQNRLTIIPVRMEDVLPNEAFAYEFATRQWIDLFADWEGEIDRLSARISAIVAIADEPPQTTQAAAARDVPAPASAPPMTEISRLQERILTTSRFTIGLLLCDIGALFAVLAVFFNIGENYGAGLPAFIVGLPLLIVGGGLMEQYDGLRIVGAVLCGLLLAAIIGILIVPPAMLPVALTKSTLALLGIFITTAGLTLLGKSAPKPGVAAQAAGGQQLFAAKMMSALASSRVFLVLTMLIYAIPTWVILFDVTQSRTWLGSLIVTQALLAAALFLTQRKKLALGSRGTVSA